MARNRYRPGRHVAMFFLGLAIAYGLVALLGTWTPSLGLDLEGGTRITLAATGNDVSETNLKEAAGIIDDRVNGSGVSEAEVTTQGNQFVTVEIPGESRQDLVDTVKRQAQLRFRVVACTSVDAACGGAGATPQAPQQPAVPGGGVTVPSAPEQGSGNNDKSGDDNSKNRPPFFAGGQKQQDKQSESPSPSESSSPSAPAQPSAGGDLVDDPLKWMNTPDPASVQAFNDYECPPKGQATLVEDDPDKPLVTCDENGVKYLLSKSMIEGTDLTSASAGIPNQSVNWAVDLKFDGDGTQEFTKISQTLYGTQKQFAIVLDGRVISAPTIQGAINGRTTITGQFDQESATTLANQLRYGALPLTFTQATAQSISTELGAEQLKAGLIAGGIGIVLVFVYALVYYRLLGLVMIASLMLSSVVVYACLVLLGREIGFTLSLAGIAGFIVSIGITADSFVVYFERLKDEIREGRTLRSAVPRAWVRARRTILSADAVSFLAAAILYILAIGDVKGFAFTLGMSTVLDLVVVFLFTHPLMEVLSRFKSFGSSRFSGLGQVDRASVARASAGNTDRQLVGAGTSGAAATGTRNRSAR
jgi:preprotein translocase subunit SecD